MDRNQVVSEFSGMMIDMDYMLNIPSIHAMRGNEDVVIDLGGGIRKRSENFPDEKIRLLKQWISRHKKEIAHNHWKCGHNVFPLSSIEPDEFQFVNQIAAFLNKHALQDNASEQLYEYVVCKLDFPVFTHFVHLETTEDCIRYEDHGAACSGICDCNGIEWDITWSITYMGADGEYDVDNKQLKDTSRYNNGANYTPHDEFFCKDPFGLNGIYKIQYDHEENDT